MLSLRLSPSQKGFTLLELIIVIAIVGLLATIIAVGISEGPKRARDGQRKTDLDAVSKALENYRADTGSYPHGNWQEISSAEGPLIPAFISRIRPDPLNNPPYILKYASYQANDQPCALATQTCVRFVLSATLENVRDESGSFGAVDGYQVTSAQ